MLIRRLISWPSFSRERIASLGLPTFASQGEKHANNKEWLRRNPSQLPGHSEVVANRVVFSDRTLGNPEPVSLQNSKRSSVRWERIGHSSVRRVMHDERSVLASM